MCLLFCALFEMNLCRKKRRRNKRKSLMIIFFSLRFLLILFLIEFIAVSFEIYLFEFMFKKKGTNSLCFWKAKIKILSHPLNDCNNQCWGSVWYYVFINLFKFILGDFIFLFICFQLWKKVNEETLKTKLLFFFSFLNEKFDFISICWAHYFKKLSLFL